MRLPEFLRTTTFRWTLAISAVFTACILVMFGFVYWQTTGYATEVVDRLNNDECNRLISAPPDRMAEEVAMHLHIDPLLIKLAGLFDSRGHRLAGNIESVPPDLPKDGTPYKVSLVQQDAHGRSEHLVRAVTCRLPDGRMVIVGRRFDEVWRIEQSVERVLAIGLLPTLCLGLAAGTLLSLRAQRRVDEVSAKIQRIVAGDLRERLPTTRVNEPFERLALLVNGMLDEIESLVQHLAGVGNDIAHDLRTPLTRVRVSLERARQKAGSLDELRGSVDQAIAGLDQSLAIITALLRIAEIEHSRRMAAFADVGLADLVREIGDLYEPIAEDKGVTFVVDAKGELTVHGDRDLLFEAVANLVDNAIKFTPAGGRVTLALSGRGDDAVVCVTDTGPGIESKEHDLVGRRFYRSDKSRGSPGLGLGLSLVNAIAKLHGFRFSVSSGPGCKAEIAGRRFPNDDRPNTAGQRREEGGLAHGRA